MGARGWAGAFIFESPFGDGSIGCHFDFATTVVVAGDIKVFEADLNLVVPAGIPLSVKAGLPTVLGLPVVQEGILPQPLKLSCMSA